MKKFLKMYFKINNKANINNKQHYMIRNKKSKYKFIKKLITKYYAHYDTYCIGNT